MDTSTNTNDVVAPFVLKTYEMVNELSTDNLIRWGKANNSFIVVEPLQFSQRLLPAFFKHNNFSSFVRQLNTYGFRKVDPDNWEFANECFLRGQKHLLKNIARRKHSNRSVPSMQLKQEDEQDEDIIMELCRLKEEQKLLEEELEGINKRIEATEKRPEQMMAFLYKVAADPGILPRVINQKENLLLLNKPNRDKKRRFMMSNNSSSSSSVATNSVKTEEDDEGTATTTTNINTGRLNNFSSPEIGFDAFYQSSPSPPEICSSRWMNQTQTIDGGGGGGGLEYYAPLAANLPVEESSGEGRFGYLKEIGGGFELDGDLPPYPFSLFRGGL